MSEAAFSPTSSKGTVALFCTIRDQKKGGELRLRLAGWSFFLGSPDPIYNSPNDNDFWYNTVDIFYSLSIGY